MKAFLLPVLFLLQSSALQLRIDPKKNLDEYFDADMSSMA
jgi:hypothetical protein